MDQSDLASDKKKAKKRGFPIVFLDESGFSLRVISGKTWAPVGNPPVLREYYSRANQSGIGFLTASPELRRLAFRFSIVSGAINTEDMIFFLTQLHQYYNKRVIVIMDRLSAHRAAANWFIHTHPDWFCFEYLPAYSPELNPVEQCWQWMKNVDLANRVARNDKELCHNVMNAAYRLDTKKTILRSFFKHINLEC